MRIREDATGHLEPVGRIEYEDDGAGHVLKTRTFDATGRLVQTADQAYDHLGRRRHYELHNLRTGDWQRLVDEHHCGLVDPAARP